MAWMPGAIRQTNIRGAGGGSYAGGPWKLVWHKTQGGSASGAFGVYANRYASPHFTCDGNTIWQHIDTSRSAYALANRGGGVETNRAHAIQVEIVGFSGTDNLAAVRQAKRIKDWAEKTHGIPAVWPGGRPPRQYVSHSGNRSTANWSKGGNFGHSQVPENEHWDPAFTDNEWQIMGSASAGSGTSGGFSVSDMDKIAKWMKDTRVQNEAAIKASEARVKSVVWKQMAAQNAQHGKTRSAIWAAAGRLVDVLEAVTGQRVANRDEFRNPVELES